ncbi:zinc finger, CCHC-type containing protein [Tanacetum coccineum]
MGDKNPILTLGDYSKPSHEVYKNTIELPVGNNVVPLRSDTIRLVQNRCSFHGLRSEDPNQHLKDFLKLVDSLDLDGENRERTRLRLFQFSLRDQASNWLERLPAGSISTWDDLTTRFLAQFFPPGRTAKLRNDILMFQQHHGESLSEAWTRFKDLLQKVPHHGIDRWLQIQIFYDHVSFHLKCKIDRAAGGKLRNKNIDEAWDTIERLAQYENEEWNDTLTSDEVSFNYENHNVEQLLGIMERKVDTLMMDAISLTGSSKGIYRLTTSEMYQQPTEPSRQEEFEHIVMNFIYDQEERIRQLESYMQDITNEFMKFSSEVALRLKERIKENESKPRKIKKITEYPDTKAPCVRYIRLIPSNPSQPRKNNCGVKPEKRSTQSHHSSSNSPAIQPPTLNSPSLIENGPTERGPSSHCSFAFIDSNHVFDPGGKAHDLSLKEDYGRCIDWEFLAHHGLEQEFFNSISTDPLSGPQWGNLFRINEPIYQELVREFFALFDFDASPSRCNPSHLGNRFRLGGEQREIYLLEFGWRIGLYSHEQVMENAAPSRLRNCSTVREDRLLMEFWPRIGNGMFNVGNTKVASIRDPRVKLAHRCLATTIAARKETTHRITEIDLYYLYYIYTPKVACNIPYWLAKYFKGMREKNLIYGRMMVTRIARSFGLLTEEWMSALSVEPQPHMFKKKSLIAMGVVMELHGGMCVWPRTIAEEEDDKSEDEGNEGVGRNACHGEAGGSMDPYRNMSQGDWQAHQAHWMGQQDERWGRLDAWMGQ